MKTNKIFIHFFKALTLVALGNLDGSIYLPVSFNPPSQEHIRGVYNAIPRNSLAELLAFGLLYPSTNESVASFQEVFEQIEPRKAIGQNEIYQLIDAAPDLISMSSSMPGSNTHCSDEAIQLIENASMRLGNRKLKGYKAHDLEYVQRIPSEEIDLARALLLAEVGGTLEGCANVRCYEAALDWMALQIQTQLKPNSTPDQKIEAINTFLFQKLHYRFPAYRRYAKQIDDYSLLGKVIEARQGVCLGVSMLYICLAQRLELDLEIITPPGHIFVRHETPTRYRNIETTAGGIHLDDENYLGLEIDRLPRRNLREVIGLAHINTGSTYWQNGKFPEALDEYAKAKKFMSDDPLLKCFTGIVLCLSGSVDQGREHLTAILDSDNPLVLQPKLIIVDYLNGKADDEALQLVYTEVDKQRPKLEDFLKKLENALQRCPQFRAGWMQLAMTWMQLQREDKALEALQRYHQIDSSDATVQYLLAELSLSRQDYPQTWKHLLKAEELSKKRNKPLKQLKQLRTSLSAVYAYEQEE